MKLHFLKNGLVLLSSLCVSFSLAGCNPSAEVPTAGDAPKKSAGEDKTDDKSGEPAKDATPDENKEVKDDPTEDESGSNP